MKGDMFIEFRGESDVCVKYDIDTSGPGSGCTVEWWFDGKSFDDHSVLDITAEEDERIAQLCIVSAEDHRNDYQDGDIQISSISPAQPIGTPLSQISTQPGSDGYAEWLRISKSWGYN